MKRVHNTDQAPQSRGLAISQAVSANGFVFVTGLAGKDPRTQDIALFDTTAQMDQLMRNATAILRAAGSSLANVVRATVYLHTAASYTEFNAVYDRYFPVDPPGRMILAHCQFLDPRILVEIEFTAVADAGA